MIFNSLLFALFLPIVFLLYWFLQNKNLKYQNLLLLVSSYYFYACWDWRFLFLLMFSTLLDTLKKDYLYLNSKKILLEAKKKYKDVYFYDDTHWSPVAAKLIALELDKLITKN